MTKNTILEEHFIDTIIQAFVNKNDLFHKNTAKALFEKSKHILKYNDLLRTFVFHCPENDFYAVKQSTKSTELPHHFRQKFRMFLNDVIHCLFLRTIGNLSDIFEKMSHLRIRSYERSKTSFLNQSRIWRKNRIIVGII